MLRNKIISLSLSFLMLICFCGCEAELTVEFDDPILEYKGNRYVDIDDEGRNLNVAWRIPDNTPSKEVNIFYGEKSEKDKTPNETGKAFKSEELNGWLLVEDRLSFQFSQKQSKLKIQKKSKCFQKALFPLQSRRITTTNVPTNLRNSIELS